MDAPAPTLQTAEEFRDAGLISPDAVGDVRAVLERYVAAVPQSLQTAITASGRDGPLARQFVPSSAELITRADERDDPIGDGAHAPVKGIVHRYPDRVLLMPTHACAVYCRFCFRREQVGPAGGTLSPSDLDAALDYIARTPAVWEVILTGGDPLILSPRRLHAIVTRLNAMDHVQVLRVHTRVPVAAPEQIDDELIQALRASAKTVYVAIHCNHPDELTASVRAACARLSDAGFVLLAQTVLLKGVNDSVATLERLMRALTAARIKPYYLHQLDFAHGTGHFRVPLEQGQALVRELRARVSGIAMPTYVVDIPGGFGKVPVAAPYLSGRDGEYAVEDRAGAHHAYREPPA